MRWKEFRTPWRPATNCSALQKMTEARKRLEPHKHSPHPSQTLEAEPRRQFRVLAPAIPVLGDTVHRRPVTALLLEIPCEVRRARGSATLDLCQAALRG